jgi:hypothetical protein
MCLHPLITHCTVCCLSGFQPIFLAIFSVVAIGGVGYFNGDQAEQIGNMIFFLKTDILNVGSLLLSMNMKYLIPPMKQQHLDAACIIGNITVVDGCE